MPSGIFTVSSGGRFWAFRTFGKRRARVWAVLAFVITLASLLLFLIWNRETGTPSPPYMHPATGWRGFPAHPDLFEGPAAPDVGNPLLGRFYLAHLDLSVPQPLATAVARVAAHARELNYLKEPLLENLHLHSRPESGIPADSVVACPLTEPTVQQALEWFGASLRADFSVMDDGGVVFTPWREQAHPGAMPQWELPFSPSWLEPPQGDGADPAADSIPPLTPLELLGKWGIPIMDPMPVTATFSKRHLLVRAAPVSHRQIATMVRLKQRNRPAAWRVSLRVGGNRAASSGTDRIVDGEALNLWIIEMGATAAKSVSRAAASGQAVTLELISSITRSEQPDWQGVWAGLQVRAEGEVVRVSGTVEYRPGTEPAPEMNVSHEAEFEALVPHGQTAILVLESAGGAAGTEAAITVH